MNYIKHLTGFFNKSNQDQTMTPTHISLYLALFQRWNLNRFKNPILISRGEIMITAKIKSKATYHKCMKDLHQKKYIIYKPSFNSYEGSEVILPDLSNNILLNDKTTSSNLDHTTPSDELNPIKKQTTNATPTSEKTATKQQTSKKHVGNSNLDTTPTNEPSQFISHNTSSKNKLPNPKNEQKDELAVPNFERTVLNFDGAVPKNGTYIKTYINNSKTIDIPPSKKETTTTSSFNEKVPPTFDLVKIYFQEKNTSHLESEKFFNYYNSNGWLVGGKTPMKDWQAAARNWMLNLEKFNRNQSPNLLNPKNLNVSNTKDYAEPL